MSGHRNPQEPLAKAAPEYHPHPMPGASMMVQNHRESVSATHVAPFIFHGTDSKSLHFSKELLQSSMCSSRPDELAVDYTRTMMGFLLFNRSPRHIAMIGLGGGSLAKFCYRYLPETKITVVEINPHVIALRKEFLIPDNDERFQVIEGDGADFLRQADTQFDVLLVDGFDHRGQPPQLCSQSFYDDCYSVLTEPGVVAINLFETHPLYELYIDRLALSFDSNMAEVVANHDGNVIVFAGKGQTISPHSLRGNIDFAHSVWDKRTSVTTPFRVDDQQLRSLHV